MSDIRICGLHLASAGVITVLLYLIDVSTATLDAYVPGEDYPVFEEVPKGLTFTCDDKIPGYYADPETSCQVWHWCVPSIGGNIMYSFLCAPGTVFNQKTRVCDWFFAVDCPNSPAYYAVNEDLYKDEAGNYIAGKKKRGVSNMEYDRRFSTRQKRHEGEKKSQTDRQITTPPSTTTSYYKKDTKVQRKRNQTDK